MIENKHLRSFLRVLDLGGFSRASRSLNIAQPALSQHVKKLEDRLGVVLLERSAHGVAPTPAGRLFAKRARQILNLVDVTERQFGHGPQSLLGEVRLGLPGSVCPVLAMPMITETASRYPNIKLIISELMSGDLADMLQEGRMDLAVLFNVAETDDYTSESLVLETLHLAGPPGDPLLAGDSIPAVEIADLPLVATRPPHGLRLLIERWSNETGIALNVTVEADAPSVLVTMAAEGSCYSILSPSAIQREIASGYLGSTKIAGPQIKRTACLCNSKRLPSDPARDAILALARQVARDSVRRGAWQGQLAG